MFENVNIDWRMQPDDGSTDFSDDEGLDDRGVPGPGGTPERSSNIPAEQRIYGSPPDHFISGSRSLEPMLGRHTPRPKSMDPNQSNERDNTFNNNNNNNLNNKSFNSASEFYQDRRAATSDWSGSTPSENSSDSPATYRIMPPPPPPQNKNKAFCKLYTAFGIFIADIYVIRVSTLFLNIISSPLIIFNLQLHFRDSL